MILTREQQLAVETREKNLLVAAAAGSGKTRVLVERIKRMILSNECDVDKLLIVTFTNAAAQEMRSRIHNALIDELKNQEAVKSEEQLERLEKQKILISGASIMTLHAFCQMLLKRNFSRIDLDPNFRVAEEQELNLICQEVIENLFETKYAEGNEDFLRFTDDFGGSEKGDDHIHNLILSLYKFSQSQPYPEKWLKSLVGAFDISEEAEIKDTIWYKPAMEHIKSALDGAYDECRITLDLAYANKLYVETIEDDLYNVILELRRAVNTGSWAKIYELINSKQFQRLKTARKCENEEAKKIIQVGRDDYKNAIKSLREKYFFATEEEIIYDLREIKPSITTLIDMTIEFAQAYTEAKREKAIIDFNDMEHLALKILIDDDGNPTKIAQTLRKKYYAIMVDEYQDTNGVQDTILNVIADKNRANFFAVGDVKQSIYRFRLADPTLFMEKYNIYPEKSECMRIDLSKNFRSRREVLNSVNFVFERLMNEESMEIPYNDEARLYYGASYYSEGNKGTFEGTPTELYIINNDDSISNEYSDDLNDENSKEAILSIEREAQLISDKIKFMMANEIKIYDKDNNTYRKLKYKDIVILLRSQANIASRVFDILEKNKIPAYSVGDESYFKAMEIQVVISLLSVLENARQDIPLAAVLLSPIGGFTAQELAQLRIVSMYDDLFTVLMTAAASTAEVNPLKLPETILKKSLDILKKINSWREMSTKVSVSNLISNIYRETGYYDYVGGLPEGVLRQANLRMLVDRATAYELTSFRGLPRFLKFIKKIKELKNDLAIARTLGENEDVVRIMTIHKSKGLEFPVVFIANLNKKFNITDEQSEFLLKHRKYGIGPYRTLKNEPLRIPTFARQLIAQKNLEEQKAEELRILYVAMTRAREKLILVGTKRNNDKKFARYSRYENVGKIPGFAPLSAETFLDWIMLALSKKTNYIVTTYVDASKIKVAENADDEQPKEVAADMSVLERKTSTLAGKSIPSKMSVTELKRRVEYFEEIVAQNLFELKETLEVNAEEVSKSNEQWTDYKKIIYLRPDFEQEKKLTGAEYGTLMHRVMQRIDLSGSLTVSGIKKQVKILVEQNILTREQEKFIRFNNLAKFFASSIGKRMIAANEIYREMPFSRLINAERFFPSISEKIFIQGIIDVLFRDKNGFVLLDYKTDKLRADNDEAVDFMKKRYQLQIELYSEAIEAIVQAPVVEKYLYMLNDDVLVAL